MLKNFVGGMHPDIPPPPAGTSLAQSGIDRVARTQTSPLVEKRFSCVCGDGRKLVLKKSSTSLVVKQLIVQGSCYYLNDFFRCNNDGIAEDIPQQ